jgi:tRNA 5-methylaminomethyl-2-thiouridine biosynthesis bifunctional protein
MAHPDVIVIGGGLAGASTAFALAQRGASVLLIESAPGLCERASGNRFALLTPYIATRTSPFERLYSVGYSWTQSLLNSSFATDAGFIGCGAIQLPSTKRFASLLQEDLPLIGTPDIRRASARECLDISGVSCIQGGFVIPSAGFVSPLSFMKSLLLSAREKVTVRCATVVSSIEQEGNSWCVTCSNTSRHYATSVVVCGAFESNALTPCSWLPLEAIRGQTVRVRSTANSSSLRVVLCFGGYLTPAVDGEHLLGAHYRHDDENQDPSDSDTEEILTAATRAVPSLDFSTSHVRSARVCFRTSTVDRMPYIGHLPNFEEMRREASTYRPGTNIREKVGLRDYPGLYVNVGHGSRGLLTGPLGGEIIARLIHNESLDSLQEAATICEPARVPYRLLTPHL